MYEGQAYCSTCKAMFSTWGKYGNRNVIPPKMKNGVITEKYAVLSQAEMAQLEAAGRRSRMRR